MSNGSPNGSYPTPLPYEVEYPRRTQDILAAGPYLFNYPKEIVPEIVLTDQGQTPGLGPSIPDAPYDSTTYGRNNGVWSNVYDAGTY